MGIQDKHLYHGAALTQIVEHPQFTALNKYDRQYGHYRINDNHRLTVKYALSNNQEWAYTFSVDELRSLRIDANSGQPAFLALACIQTAVTLLTMDQVQLLIDLNQETQQWITLTIRPRQRIRARGSLGLLPGTIARNLFPGVLFED